MLRGTCVGPLYLSRILTVIHSLTHLFNKYFSTPSWFSDGDLKINKIDIIPFLMEASK